MNTIGRDPSDRVQVLDEDGNLVGDPPEIDEETLVDIYQDMKLARHFDQRAVSLQRQGRMGTYPPLSGQEGAQVGSAHALADGDWMVPSYREHGAALVGGLPLKQTLLYWMGSEEGNNVPEDANILPVAVPIASQVPHAAGLAWSWKLQDKDDTAGICYFGDGATSEGDFHEGLNFAGVNDVPMVFFCNNNQWAISVPRERQTASETLAQKANAYGFEGIQVDGMDPLAVYKVTQEALEKARNPEDDQLRPTMIEAVQYRFGAHTTADDPTVYRDEDEVEEWKAKDPIPRLETYLRAQEILDDERVAEIESEIEERVADAIDAAEAEPRPEPEEMFEHTYAELPPQVRQQREEFLDSVEKHGKDAFLEE
ncbi:pyruvate dehydrogenase (acetyl-transferring) E1 component subunit alpha [Halolamina sp.]|jgi:pyruvate dehydrogenase E1 component alpha subunit|uniref:pyruvate dehydrogenase (acetyl-transferring) E1 component subunit alpha n=1 Tax=Halolamina sp. TaxID=1940283 RepID=UPI003561B3CE